MLQIGSTSIKRISGPISLLYLKPLSPNLPLLLLFGDLHFSESDICKDCTPDNNCYAIYDKAFLSSIDSLAKEYPVDFYTEFAEQFPISEEGGILFYQMERNTFLCHDVKGRSSVDYEDLCPTSRVRWHYADSRFFSKYIEGVTFIPYKTILEQHLSSIEKSSMLSSWEIPDSELVQQGRQIMIKVFVILSDAIEKRLSYSQFQQEFVQVLEEILSHKYSAIRKQHLRIDWKRLWQTRYLTSRVDEILEYLYSESDVVKELLQHSVNPVNSFLPVERARYLPVARNLSRLLGILSVPLLDAYQISRMLKVPKENVPSCLSLGFFGNAHCINITEFLTGSLGYVVQYEKDNEESRCITIDEMIDLGKDLEPYRERDLSLYHKKIKQEEEAREEQRIRLEQIEIFNRLKEVPSEIRKIYHLRPSQIADLEVYTEDLSIILHRNVEQCSRLVLGYANTLIEDCSISKLDTVIDQWCNSLFRKRWIARLIVSCVIASISEVLGVKRTELYQTVEEVLKISKDQLIAFVKDVPLRTGACAVQVKQSIVQEEDDMYA